MSTQISDYENTALSLSLDENMQLFKNIFSKESVLRFKKIEVRESWRCDCAIFYLDGMVNVELLNESIVRPLLTVKQERTENRLAEYIVRQVLFASEAKVTSKVPDMIRAMLYGDTLLLIDGCAEAVTVNTKGWRTRGISEPDDEKVLQGPREGFDEAAMFNLAMIRRKLLTPDFCTEMMRIGRRSDTIVFICYLDSLVRKKTLDELKKSEGIAQFAEDDSQAYVSLRTENIADIYHNVSYPDELGVVTCCRKIYGESGDVVGLIFADILPSNLYDYALSGSAFDGATVFISSGNFFFGYGGNEQSEELLTGGGEHFRFEASSDELPLTVTVFDGKGEYNAMVWTLTGALGGVSVMLIIGVHFAAKRTATAFTSRLDKLAAKMNAQNIP